jgi:hypothetical protein
MMGCLNVQMPGINVATTLMLLLMPMMMNGELRSRDCDRGGCAERNNNKSDGGGGWDVDLADGRY